jgi:hypothetical protein
MNTLCISAQGYATVSCRLLTKVTWDPFWSRSNSCAICGEYSGRGQLAVEALFSPAIYHSIDAPHSSIISGWQNSFICSSVVAVPWQFHLWSQYHDSSICDRSTMTVPSVIAVPWQFHLWSQYHDSPFVFAVPTQFHLWSPHTLMACTKTNLSFTVFQSGRSMAWAVTGRYLTAEAGVQCQASACKIIGR